MKPKGGAVTPHDNTEPKTRTEMDITMSYIKYSQHLWLVQTVNRAARSHLEQ